MTITFVSNHCFLFAFIVLNLRVVSCKGFVFRASFLIFVIFGNSAFLKGQTERNKICAPVQDVFIVTELFLLFYLFLYSQTF